MGKRKNSIFITPLFVILVAAMFIMAIASYWWNHYMFVAELIFAIAALVGVFVSMMNYKKYLAKIVTDAASSAEDVDIERINNISMPVAILGENNEIVMVNDVFRKNIIKDDDPTGDFVEKFLSDSNPDSLFDENGTDTYINGKWYIAFAVRSGESLVVYFVDDNDYKVNSDEFLDSRPAVAIIAFDNKEELERDSEEGEASRIKVLVEKAIAGWVSKTKGFYKKLSGGRYLAVFEERNIKQFVDEKFKILEEIREIEIDDRMNATISIGVGRGASNFKESELWARQALEMALGRGGDQVAVKKNETYQFFGGLSKGIEKRDKVRTRVIAAALTNHVNNSSNVIIMGHRYSDLDSVGACIGMWSAVVKGLHRNAYICIDKQQTLAKSLVKRFEDSGFESIFKNEVEAYDIIDEHTLLIIVDTHSPNFVESKAVYEKCKKVVVIDHHRMMVNHIDNAVVFYHSGIMLDTKNFVLRTGVRTFEAAAYLRSNGADTVEVKRMFSNSIDTYKVKYKLVSEAEVFNHCAVSYADTNTPDIRIASAQAADELLGIEGVRASFVMYKTGRTINISARSLGDLNVQVIMEALGGGGHHTMAACQLEGVSPEEAKQRLLSIIKDIEINKTKTDTGTKK